VRRASSITPKKRVPLDSGAISTAGMSIGATCRLSPTGTTTQWPRRRTHSKSGTLLGVDLQTVAIVASPLPSGRLDAATART
jgi:hypothetical protein